MLVLGWLLAIIFYLLGALTLFLLDFDCVYTLADWFLAIGLASVWPVFTISGVWIVYKDRIDENRQRQARSNVRI